VERDIETKIQSCSPSTALVMAISAFSILRPCIFIYLFIYLMLYGEKEKHQRSTGNLHQQPTYY